MMPQFLIDSYVYVVDELLRYLVIYIEESEQDHPMFLHVILAKWERCLAFWFHHDADLNRGATNHPDWIALDWDRVSNASLQIMRFVDAFSEAFLAAARLLCGVELDMYVHVPDRMRRKEISRMNPRAHNHHLFFYAVGSLCKSCVQTWLDRGADSSYGTSCEPRNVAREDPGGRGSIFNAECSRDGIASVRYAIFSLFLGCRCGEGTLLLFPIFGSFGADNRCAAATSGALRGDLEMFKDICDLIRYQMFEMDDRKSVFPSGSAASGFSSAAPGLQQPRTSQPETCAGSR